MTSWKQNTFDSRTARDTFLTDAHLENAAADLSLPDDAIAAFRRVLPYMRDDGTLRDMALASLDILLGKEDPAAPIDGFWQDKAVLEARLGRDAGMFYAVVLLGCLPKTAEWYRNHGIPYSIFTDTMTDIVVWMNDYRKTHGAWGLENVGWLRYHLSGRLFRVGRLQFAWEPFTHKIHVYRHRETGEIGAFPFSGIRFNGEGFIDGSNGMHDETGGWTSSFEAGERQITGSPILPEGRALREPVTIPAGEWERVLTEGDPILQVHIPEGPDFAPEAWRASYGLALGFYGEHFPGNPIHAFVCSSWLLTPQFRRLLPDTSNIVRFQRDYYLFPVLSREEDTLWRVFRSERIDPAAAPRETGLQRAIAGYMEEGGRMIGSGGFFLPEAAREWRREQDV